MKTKRQLNLGVPAGFWETLTHSKQVRHHLQAKELGDYLPEHDSSTVLSSEISDTSPDSNINPDSWELPTSLPENTESSSLATVMPIIRSVDKPSSSLPQHITMTEDFLPAGLGFRRIDTIKSKFADLYKDTVTIDSMPADAVLDHGDLASIRKKPRNTTPVPRPSRFGQVVHMDIIFGPEIALGTIHYGLLFTDRYSRLNYLYPLQNLTTDIPKQLQAFFAHIGHPPSRLLTDFDLKLIGGKARAYLNSLLIHVNAAPALSKIDLRSSSGDT